MQNYIDGRKVALKALVGSNNYNLATPESDKDYKAFVIPTFEDLYEGKKYAKQTIGETEDLDVHDIRKLPELFFKANINFLEVLFSNEINMSLGTFVKDSELIEIFLLRKEIAKMNLPYFFNACNGMHVSKMNLLYKGTEGTQHLVDKYGYDTKQALHAFRALVTPDRFAETDFTDFKYAITFDDKEREFMLNIKNGGLKANEFEEFVKQYCYDHFEPLKKKYHSFEPNVELKIKIEELIMKMIKRNLF